MTGPCTKSFLAPTLSGFQWMLWMWCQQTACHWLVREWHHWMSHDSDSFTRVQPDIPDTHNEVKGSTQTNAMVQYQGADTYLSLAAGTPLFGCPPLLCCVYFAYKWHYETFVPRCYNNPVHIEVEYHCNGKQPKRVESNRDKYVYIRDIKPSFYSIFKSHGDNSWFSW